MSGVYIKGMEMPKKCIRCPVNVWGRCLVNNDKDVSKSAADAVRDKDCPLISVPDHGRLIDADGLMERFSYSTGDTAEDMIWIRAARRIIIEAPTVIPADRKE